MKIIAIPIYFIALFISCSARKTTSNQQTATNTQQPTASNQQQEQQPRIMPAAERINVYLPLLKGKRVGVFANNTSMVGNSHLVDTLLKLGVNITVAFGPEHGFRGDTPDGIQISDYKDEKTGVKVVSLYGSKRRPTLEDDKRC
jgi:uncharacterized protein YbbC (DUF1343 family)